MERINHPLPPGRVPELLLSTPRTIVLRARAEFSDGSGAQEAGLVIPRQDCQGERPSAEALRNAAWMCATRLGRCGGAVRRLYRLLVRVEGRWVPLLELPRGALAQPA